MHVQIDKARHHEGLAQIDHRGVLRQPQLRGGAVARFNRPDAALFDHQCLGSSRRLAGYTQQLPGVYDRAGCGNCGGRRAQTQRADEGEKTGST